MAAESAQQANPVTQPQGQANPAPNPAPDLTSFVANLSPEQLAKVRSLAASAGLSTGPRKTASGGLIIEVEVPEQVIEPFTEWAQSAGEPLVDFIRKIAANSLIAYCFQDWGAQAMQQQTTTAAAAATTTTAGA
jgi:hypothetical protein